MKKIYKRPLMKVVYSYDLDTELMYGNDLSGGTFGEGPGFSIGSRPNSTSQTDPDPEDLTDWEDSDR